MRAVAGAANWYPEHTDALRAMVRARDHAAIRQWAASDTWDTIAHETEDDDGTDSYAEDVRSALRDLADVVEDRVFAPPEER